MNITKRIIGRCFGFGISGSADDVIDVDDDDRKWFGSVELGVFGSLDYLKGRYYPLLLQFNSGF